MKEYRVRAWNQGEGPGPIAYGLREVFALLEHDDLVEAGWDNVVLEVREVSEWEEV